jgi:peroxiredoxin
VALPSIDFARVGPVVGARFPDVRLPDQHGRTVDLHEARAGRKALVVFHRSAGW